MIQIKRVYEAEAKDDGRRLLVDRLWPRGISKEEVKIYKWYKDLAPSNELRKWYNHEPDKWELFKRKYKAELADKKDLLDEIRQMEKENKNITLLYSSKEEKYNNAAALKEFLANK
jgi:uncharacterized protein YeaO (DUF488 family)